MKLRYKLIFILIIVLFIVIIFFLLNKEEVINKSITKQSNNYSYNIIYPYFTNNKLDNYLKDYIDDNINEIIYKDINNNTYLFIDYDYYTDKDNIFVTFYKYLYNNNTFKYDIYNINYNLKDNKIVSKIENTNYTYYDIINNKEISKDKPMIAFTFDDGPSHNTNKIINSLVKYNATASFFLVGNKVSNYPKTLNRLIDTGMDIGNHTYSHKLLTRLKEQDIKNEIEKTNDAIYALTNVKPLYFRPSYGSVNKKIKKISNMPIIIWNIDTMDWKYHNSKKIANKILKYASDGDIILMHDTYSATANAIEIVLPKLIEKGYQIVSVKELFYYKEVVPKLGSVYGYVN